MGGGRWAWRREPCYGRIIAQGRYAACLRHDGPAELVWLDAWLADSADSLRAGLLRHDPLAVMPSAMLADTAPERFSGAWKGLLAAILGLRSHSP